MLPVRGKNKPADMFTQAVCATLREKLSENVERCTPRSINQGEAHLRKAKPSMDLADALSSKYGSPGCAHFFAATLHKALVPGRLVFQYDLDHRN